MGGDTDKLDLAGIVLETLPGAQFKVKIDDPNYPNYIVTATISGKMRMNYIRILPGDRVNLEVSVYDLTKGRITYRHKEMRKTA